MDAQVAAQRATKARAVGRQAANFIKAYVVAFGNSACTVYTHYVAHHLAHQIRDIPCDVMALSGQALEHCNQLRKQEGKLTSKNPQPWSETKDHKRKRTMMDELWCSRSADCTTKSTVSTSSDQRAGCGMCRGKGGTAVRS